MYWLGILDTETFRFEPEESEPTLLDVGNDYMCAGSGFVDPVSGKNISFALAKCAEHTSIGQMAASGWAGTVTLLREYSLALDGTLRIVPYEEYSKLHDNLLVCDGVICTVQEAKYIDPSNACIRRLAGSCLPTEHLCIIYIQNYTFVMLIHSQLELLIVSAELFNIDAWSI